VRVTGNELIVSNSMQIDVRIPRGRIQVLFGGESRQTRRREKLKLGGKWLGWLGPGRRKQACFASLLRLTGDG
jgi:hypothetical protein